MKAPPTATMRRAHEDFLAGGQLAAGVRPVVADSWRRSARIGVDPEHLAPPVDISAADLTALREGHPLAAAVPVVRSLLLEPDAGWIAALTDAEGRLLWIDGDRQVRRTVERVGFVEGALWREDVAGTNAPGTALATGRAVQVLGAEHWSRPVHAVNCAAAPVHAPDGSVLGVLDITGGKNVASGMAHSLVRATVAAVEAILAERAGASGSLERSGTAASPLLAVLGGGGHVRLRRDGDATALSGRHAEILLLLAEHRQGLSAEELAVHLSGTELSTVAVRVEISRLRRTLRPLLAESRPYRLRAGVHTDIDAVRAALAAGDLARALASYPGPVLPRSDAPGVERVRAELEAQLRAAVLTSNDLGALARWSASESGETDWWAHERLRQLQAQRAPAGSGHATFLQPHAT